MQLTARPEPLPRSVVWTGAATVVALSSFGAVYAMVARSASPSRVVPALVVALLVTLCAPLLPRRFTPRAIVVAGAGVCVCLFGQASNAGWFAACVLIGAAVWTSSYAFATAVWAGFTAVVLAGAVVAPDAGWIAWTAGCAFSLFGFGTARRQRELVGQLRSAQAGLAATAQVEERARIARELHDVIAHSLTVSLMHVSAARLAMAEDPSDAERALAEAERLGRASLDEVRHAVGTLRTAGVDPTTPLPGSTDLPRLLVDLHDAGVPLQSSVVGDLTSLPATVALATYRIVQEALTNAAKHASGAVVSACIVVGHDAVVIDVDSAGPPRAGHGLGLVGMRERATAVGGTCDSGPGGPGWRVHAVLPLVVAT